MFVAGRVLQAANFDRNTTAVSTAGLTLLLLGGADMVFEQQIAAKNADNLYLEMTPTEDTIDEMAGLGLQE